MTLNEFEQNFNEIKEKGFIPTMRKGPTGIGYTLETLLGIKENNDARPDIDGAELKAHRSKSNNMITLFTFNNKVWKMPPLEAIRKYGSLDRTNNRMGLYYTMSLKPNSVGLFLHIDTQEISVRHISGEIIAVWKLYDLAQRFMQKLPALLLVSAFTEERDNLEYFHFYRAQLLKGTSPNLLANQFKEENILVDLRLHDKGTMARNHGTGFRVFENKLFYLFESITDL
ncbi:MvaI/BcnI family restriction endonuclease [Helicobacter cetorum]|uniref:MvaI/BcnI family restriction endonuclease n=1 Tax=Helicobacter cetorum TaxID=138563 RepID=UPI000CF10EDA|nr:MvaI/BcnI family restriction endonuclease [Helicobacter cetorum]